MDRGEKQTANVPFIKSSGSVRNTSTSSANSGTNASMGLISPVCSWGDYIPGAAFGPCATKPN